MALTQYNIDTRQLLQNAAATTSLYPDQNIIRFINIARRQIAGEAKCVRAFGTLALVTGQQVYNFNGGSGAINPGISGVQSVLHVRQVSLVLGNGAKYVASRPFEYFQLYFLNQSTAKTGQTTHWAQYGEGTLGSLYVYPTPDTTYTLNLDTACLPIDLVDDTTIELIPPIWTDAVPFYAAYRAYLSAQRPADAKNMYEQYDLYMQRARTAATPDVLSGQYPQNTDATLPNKLGFKPPRAGAG